MSNHGGARTGAGRKLTPADIVRPHRVVISVSSADLARLERLAVERRLPLGALAHTLVQESLHRRPRRSRPRRPPVEKKTP